MWKASRVKKTNYGYNVAADLRRVKSIEPKDAHAAPHRLASMGWMSISRVPGSRG